MNRRNFIKGTFSSIMFLSTTGCITPKFNKSHFASGVYKDTIYSCNYKGFKVLVFDNNNLIIEKNKNKNVFVPPSSTDHIPISYNGIFWELKIKEQELIDFSYKFCEPDTEVFYRLKSIPITDNTKTKKEE